MNIAESEGELVIHSATEGDEGAYNCEALNKMTNEPVLSNIAQVIINPSKNYCSVFGYFNKNANSMEDCLLCFCSGMTRECAGEERFYSFVSRNF